MAGEITESVESAIRRVLRNAGFLPGEDIQYSWKIAALPAADRLALASALAGPDLIKLARRVAFLAAFSGDAEDYQAMMYRELARLFAAFEALGEEPDLTFCCGCREEIDLEAGQEQWVLDGAKYHAGCYTTAKTQR